MEQYIDEIVDKLKKVCKSEYCTIVIDEEIKEPLGGAHTNHEETASNMKVAINNALSELSKLSVDKLREERYAKFRAMGRFIEG